MKSRQALARYEGQEIAGEDPTRAHAENANAWAGIILNHAAIPGGENPTILQGLQRSGSQQAAIVIHGQIELCHKCGRSEPSGQHEHLTVHLPARGQRAELAASRDDATWD
jgi:hypothetical protein